VTGAIATAFGYAQVGTDFTTITLEAPVTVGQYLIHWMTSGAQSIYDAYQPLFVQATGAAIVGVEWPIVDPAQVRPTIQEVALLEQIRTVDLTTGAEQGTFNDATRPTGDQVEDLIDKAIDDMVAELPRPNIDPSRWPQLKRAVEFYAAMLIEGSFYKEQQADRGALVWQQEYQEAMLSLQAGITSDMAQNNLLGAMEPRLT
jgi:hypothetical protein